MDLRIDPEFAEKIPPITAEEFRKLEENILADGKIINPLIVWNGVIVDGHNRYRIICRHPELKFEVFERDFYDRYEAFAWICRNQLGRRNLTEAQRKYLAGKQYEAEKAMRGGLRNGEVRDPESGQFTAKGQNVPLRSGRTSERIAKQIGRNEKYVRRAEKYAKGLDAAEEAAPGIRTEILSGAIRPADSDVEAVAMASPEERKELAVRLRMPRPSPHQKGKQPAPPPEEFDINISDMQAIADRMGSGPDRKPNIGTEFIITELGNALESMMLRWETCIGDYRKEAAAADCREKIKELALEGITYLSQFTGGKQDAEQRNHVGKPGCRNRREGMPGNVYQQRRSGDPAKQIPKEVPAGKGG